MTWVLRILIVIAGIVMLVVTPGFESPGTGGAHAPVVGISWEDATPGVQLPTRTVLTAMKVAPIIQEGFLGAWLGTTYTGRVFAESLPACENGTAFPAGWVEIQRPDGQRTITHPDAAGYFSVMVYREEPTPGMEYRAAYLGTPTCAASISEPLVAATALPDVKATPVRVQSRVRVNVNPNLVKGNWRFVVARHRPSDVPAYQWQWVRTYQTRGSREIRTINLPAGTYKVYVYPQRNHAGAWSGEVTLLR